MQPLVSVILCTRNEAEYVCEAIDSVIDQTYTNWELIVIDNGSTDGSHELLRPFEQDRRIRLLLHKDHDKVTARFNEALSLCRGSFVSILYGDDYYLPGKLQRQVDCFSDLAPEVGVVHSPGYRENVFTRERWLDSHTRASGNILLNMLAKDAGVNPISPLVRRECFDTYPFNEQLFGEWEAIYFRIAMRYRFHHLDEPLVVMRDHERNSGKSMKHNVERGMFILDQLKAEPEFPAEYLEAVEGLRARILRDGGWRVARHGTDVAWARECLLAAIRLQWRLGLQRKTVLGLGLTLLPGPVRSAVNRCSDGLRRQKVTVRHTERPDIQLRPYERRRAAG